MVYRKELEDLINDNGGDYRANLTKDVTHLIAKEPSGAKYNYAAQWGIKTVSVEWLEQSLERGMILEENLYHLLLPPGERGRNAWIRRSVSTTSLGKRARDDDVIPPNARKLRRTASARLSSHNDGLWTEINGGEIKVEEIKVDSWDEPQKEGVDHRMSPDVAQAKMSAPAQIPPGSHLSKRIHSVANLSPLLRKSPQQEGLFQGKTFLLRGFDEIKVCDIPFLIESGDNNELDCDTRGALAFTWGRNHRRRFPIASRTQRWFSKKRLHFNSSYEVRPRLTPDI